MAEHSLVTRSHICFICGSVTNADNTKPYNEGGLGWCGFENSWKKVLQSKDFYLKHPEYKYFSTAERLQFLLSGVALDPFALDVYYHNKCYLNYHLQAKEIKTFQDEDYGGASSVTLFK